jgi:catechol 2,3-dioxygenase-like lactoylglutathione lyase family enzyme
MLKDLNIGVVLATKDLQKAKEFYGGKLGFEEVPGDKDMGGVRYKSGGGMFFVYETPHAGTNQATAAGWSTDNIEPIVEELKSKGVEFEHYEMPGVQMQGDIHVMEPFKTVWFKDPDGNILNINSGM